MKKICKKYKSDKINQYNYLNNCFLTVAITVCDAFDIEICKQGLALLYPYRIDNDIPISLKINEPMKNISELLNMSGVNYLTRNCSKNLIETIINDLDNNRQVVLYIDCFYDSMSKYSFGRFHSRHYIIVCEYKLSENSFLIIQHDYANENRYQFRKISFSELEKCYYGGINHYKNEKPTYYWFYKADEDKKIYTKEIVNHHLLADYKHSVFVLEQFLQFFYICVKESATGEHLLHFSKNFRDILQIKKCIATFYSEQLGEEDGLSAVAMQIAYAWNQLYKFVENNRKSSDELSKNISEILNLESSLYLKLEKILNKTEDCI